MTFDIGNVLVNLFKYWDEKKQITAWTRLILSTLYSGFLGLTGGWGAALVAHASPWVAFGTGLLTCAGSVTAVLLNSPEARSLLIAMPKSVTEQYQNQPETIVRPQK